MHGFTTFALRCVPSFMVICFVLLGTVCVAQEVDVPVDVERLGFAPSGWTELITPVQNRVDLKLYGFYIGEVGAPSAQADVTFRATKFLSITPSYLYYSVPANGLNELANVSQGFTRSYQEHQFRIDGTVMFSIHKFEISERNMYVRRFLPAMPMKSIAIAIGSRSRIPSWLKATSGNLSRPTKLFTTREADGRKTESGLASRCRLRTMCRFSRRTCLKALRELKTSTT